MKLRGKSGYFYCRRDSRVTDWADKEKGSRQPAVNTVKKRVLRMVSSSIQFAFSPFDALSHRGIEIQGFTRRSWSRCAASGSLHWSKRSIRATCTRGDCCCWRESKIAL